MLKIEHKRITLVGTFLAILCLVIVIPNWNFTTNPEQIIMDSMDDMLEEDHPTEVIVEGSKVFHTAAEGDDYIDSFASVVHGFNSSAPPLGMGEDSTTATEITEEYYTGNAWENVLTQLYFPGTPSGWTAFGMDYNYDYFYDKEGETMGLLQSVGVKTTDYENVSFSLDIRASHGIGFIAILFNNSTSDLVLMGYVPSGTDGTITFASSDSQFQHNNFFVEIAYNIDDTSEANFMANNWQIDGRYIYFARGVDVTYRFDAVDFNNFTSEELFIDFDTNSSAEYLDFRFETNDSTPDHLIAANQNTSFSVNIHSLLNGSICYLNIRDVSWMWDEDIDYWRIQRVYIRLINSEPEIEQAPLCTNLDEDNNLFARYKIYEFTTNVVDLDGISHVDTVSLSSLDSSLAVLRWTVTYHEDSDTFVEDAGSDYIELVTSTFSKGTTYVNITFRLYIEWEHPISIGDCLSLVVLDDQGGMDEVDNMVYYDYETRLDVHDFKLDDDSGIRFRGDISGSITASGVISYLGSDLHPNGNEVDVWIHSDLNSNTGPWIDSTLDSGIFSVIVSADNCTGVDIYVCGVVVEGEGPNGTSLLFSQEDCYYLTDQIVVVGYSTIDTNLQFGEASECEVILHYELDNTPVINGTVSVNGIPATYTGEDGVWNFTETCSPIHTAEYNTVSVAGNNVGVTVVNQNNQSLEVTWSESSSETTTTTTTSATTTTTTTRTTATELSFDLLQVTIVGVTGFCTGAIIVIVVMLIFKRNS